jgi:hypothetical protein
VQVFGENFLTTMASALPNITDDKDKDDRKVVRMIYYFIGWVQIGSCQLSLDFSVTGAFDLLSGQIIIEHTARGLKLKCRPQILKHLLEKESAHSYIPR